MKLNKLIKENPKVSDILSVIFHVLLVVILYSVLMMYVSLFTLHLDWDRGALMDWLPYAVGLPLYVSFYFTPSIAPYWFVVVVIFLTVSNWFLSTRIKRFNQSVPRRAFSFILSWGTLVITILFYVVRKIKYIGYDRVVKVHDTVNPIYEEYLHRGALELVGYTLMILPILVMGMYVRYLYGKYQEDPHLQEWFRTYKFERGWIGRFGEDNVNRLPDIQLARNAETKAPVILEGESRQVGTLLIGPPGSGKTSIKIKTAFRQDLGHMQRMINDFKVLVDKYGYNTPEFLKHRGNHLIGTVIIEPAKDLCDDAYELAVDHNIPKEFITYLDPSNPETPGFNAMVGPTAQVVETITSVLEAIAETKDEFFRQAARAVLKNYVYLMKFYNGDESSIPLLDDMYQDPRLVMDMLIAVEKTVPSEDKIMMMTQDERIHWMIVKKILQWFRNEGVSEKRDRDGMVEKYPRGHIHEGKIVVEDLQYEFTRQTRNLLSDITKNPYLARVLMAKNEVNLDRLMSKGGILLVNTDNGNLQDLSDTFGKLVLLCVQNAVFRREGTEKTRPLVSMYADEFYDYMNTKFLKLTGQGRKYKFAPLVACQSLTQFGVKFGKDFTESMLGTIRNTIVYGGVSTYDAELLSKYLGKTTVEEIQTRESFTPDEMEKPNYSYSESTVRTEKELASADDIMFQEFRFSYIRMVQDKSSKRAIRAEGDFVDTADANKWKKALNAEAMEFFMEYWRKDEHVNQALVVSEEEGDTLTALKKELLSLDNGTKEVEDERPRFKRKGKLDVADEGDLNTSPKINCSNKVEERKIEAKVNQSIPPLPVKRKEEVSIFDDVPKEDKVYFEKENGLVNKEIAATNEVVSFSHMFWKKEEKSPASTPKQDLMTSFSAAFQPEGKEVEKDELISPTEPLPQEEVYEESTQNLKTVEIGQGGMDLLDKIMKRKNN
jgi:hypothetical protein